MRHADSRSARRGRLRYRAWRRGTLEMDLLMGRFADARLDAMDEAQLERFEHLLEQADPDIQDWIHGRCPVPRSLRGDIMEMMLDFHKTR